MTTCGDRCPFDGPAGPVHCTQERDHVDESGRPTAHTGPGKRWPNLDDPQVRASLRREHAGERARARRGPG